MLELKDGNKYVAVDYYYCCYYYYYHIFRNKFCFVSVLIDIRSSKYLVA